MEYKYIPKKEMGIEGYVLLKLLPRAERLAKLQDIKFDRSEDGEVKVNNDHIKYMITAEKMVKEQVIEFKIRHIETKVEFNSLDEFSIYQESNDLLNELIDIVLNGLRLGKSLSKS